MSDAGKLRILIPNDGSESAQHAIAYLLDLVARGLAVEMHVLNVQAAVRGAAASLVSSHDLEGYHRDEGMTVLADSLRQIEQAGLKAHAHVSVGEPGEVILAFAHRLPCDQIVMGRHGHGAVAKLLLGSVAQHVVVHASMPVTLVR